MSWYAFGDVVLDRLLDRQECRVVQVFLSPQESVSPAELRSALGLRSDQQLSITDEEPRIIIEADRYVISSAGAIMDRITGEICNGREPSFELRDFELLAADIVRIYRLMNRYSELVTDRQLTARIVAELSHLRSLAPRFPDLELIFLASAST